MEQTNTDLMLIEKILNGQTDQYSLLVKRHQRFVFTLALRFAKNREDAEEIAQDCFIKAYKALGTFKQTSKFSTWLYTITYTTAMTFLRKKRLDTSSIDDEDTFIQLENHTSGFMANGYEKKDGYKFLNEAITQLMPDDAAIITLFYQGEQSLEEIGASLNMEPNTVKVKLHRARQRLREKLQYLLKDEVKELL
ncbi:MULTISPECIES: RNA polymerase sigma factor [unclassified Pedobacter]|uniref:RNA polymerase sigma factor n=1 Tax=unclassified Pedobacter TaxID=2628915 RepID=UPI000B4B7596|nr:MULTISPECIES: sigma-70 family RNA polymerase sigma factor [unclassified Pedobacter]MCX2432005.1 sigma-70 family RNA polymerase sigma factor [Pedobacter sp. GR22-10]MCX2582552.1 sigma-70 family RNA polymerase sigma factor [Pedobacter sp. MR22-3]OWK72690.1 RNA polymerase subunit sigma [Pedobacter sp. AJM]